MESNRRMVSAGALAVAIAILAAPGFFVPVRADTPAASPAPGSPPSAQAAPADSAPARPAMPADTTRPAPADTARLQPALPDSGAAPAPPKLKPAPTPSPAPAPSPAPLQVPHEGRARPARTRPAAVAGAEPADPWARGTHWITANFGYARSGEPGAAPAGYGGALAVRHMITPRWSGSLQAGFDLLGRYDTAKEYEWPITLQIARHYPWKTVVHPYVGVGWGIFRHQYRGTGLDTHRSGSGVLVGGGLEAPVGGRTVIGLDGRYVQVHNKQGPPNPVFDGERTFAVRYAVRLTWSVIL